VEFRILGPLEVVDRDRPIQLGHGNERALLALLLLRKNEVVGTDSLIEELWRGDPPATASKALQVYVSRLRKRLGSEVLLTRPPGYAVVVGPDELDLSRFERLVEEARLADPAEAASKLRDAVSLWRGPPLADLADEPFAQVEIARLEELRLSAVEDRIDADLALGRHADVVAELESLVARIRIESASVDSSCSPSTVQGGRPMLSPPTGTRAVCWRMNWGSSRARS
jgi:DNA-binding SARP family transcriptional activator